MLGFRYFFFIKRKWLSLLKTKWARPNHTNKNQHRKWKPGSIIRPNKLISVRNKSKLTLTVDIKTAKKNRKRREAPSDRNPNSAKAQSLIPTQSTRSVACKTQRTSKFKQVLRHIGGLVTHDDGRSPEAWSFATRSATLFPFRLTQRTPHKVKQLL